MEAGTSADYLAELIAYWRDHYDWRAHEQQINLADNYRVELDGVRSTSSTPLAADRIRFHWC